MMRTLPLRAPRSPQAVRGRSRMAEGIGLSPSLFLAPDAKQRLRLNLVRGEARDDRPLKPGVAAARVVQCPRQSGGRDAQFCGEFGSQPFIAIGSGFRFNAEPVVVEDFTCTHGEERAWGDCGQRRQDSYGSWSSEVTTDRGKKSFAARIFLVVLAVYYGKRPRTHKQEVTAMLNDFRREAARFTDIDKEALRKAREQERADLHRRQEDGMLEAGIVSNRKAAKVWAAHLRGETKGT